MIVESYLQLSDEDKFAYCNVEGLGNLIMGVGENTVNFETRLNVFFIFSMACSEYVCIENLKIASILFIIVSFLAGNLKYTYD